MKNIILYLFFVSPWLANAQVKRNNNWITGYSGNRINFNYNIISTYQGVYFPFKYFTAGNSCISDTNGNLVLASDGYNVYNSSGSFIEDGDTLIPLDFYLQEFGWSAYSQGSIFLPMDNNKYYHVVPAFSDLQFNDCLTNNNCHFDLLLYNVIDMNANGGLGKVTKRMQPLLQNANLRKTQMMACRHGNGKDWWLLKNEGDNADVHTFLFTQDSVYDKGVQTFATPNWGPWDIRGQSTFNSDGSMFATTSHCNSCGLIFIANFDRCYGIISNPRTLQMPLDSQHNPADTTWTDRLPVGLSFSPNSQLLYVAGYSNIYQYNLQDSTWFHVAELDTSAQKFQGYETMYSATDGKIYIGNFGGLSKQMSRIDNPDIKGAGCNFCPRCLRLDSLGANGYVGTPPCMADYGLGAKVCWPEGVENMNVSPHTWSVYPNPSHTTLTIKNSQGYKKTLYNGVGQLILSTQSDEISVSTFPKGMYYIQCEGQTKKVVVE